MSDLDLTQEFFEVNTDLEEDVPYTVHRGGTVTRLDERRTAREQSKAEPAMPDLPDFSDPRILEMWRMGVKAFERQEKRKTLKEGSGKVGSSSPSCETPSLALRYAHHFSQDTSVRIGNTKSGSRTMYLWHNPEARWVAQSDDDARSDATRWLSKHAPEKADADLAKKCLKTAFDLHSHSDKKLMPRPNRHKPILPVIGAYLYIDERGRIEAFAPNDAMGVTHRVPAKLDWTRVDEHHVYTPRPLPANCKLVQFLDKFVPDLEIRTLLQEAVGSSLLPSAGFHKGFMLIGGGSNGKSTLLHLLSALHPERVTLDLTTLVKDGSAIADLEGKTLALSTETPPFLGREVEERLKAVIAGDEMRARALYQAARWFEPHVSVWVAANEPIRFTDRSDGQQDRWLTIPFNVRIPRDSKDNVRNFHLQITESPEELSYLLDWALEGVARLCRNGRQFSAKPDVMKVMDEARRIETDPTYAWMIEADLRQETHEETAKAAVYQDYCKTLNVQENRPLAAAQFWRAVRDYCQARNWVLQERNPSGGYRHAARPGRMVNLSIRGVKAERHAWGVDPATSATVTELDAELPF